MEPARPRYRAFISYSHRDKAVAAWLHHALETYRIPAKLTGRETPQGPVPRRLTPIFRDRDELPATNNLGAAIEAALRDSGHLIVICSPAAAASRWVDQEIATFKRLHGDDRVLALIASGEPNASAMPGREAEECFPPSLRVQFDPQGRPTSTPAEPIAADVRPDADGRRLARMKLIAGLVGVGVDDLARRDTQRRVRRLIAVAAAAVAGMVIAIGLALYANEQRIEANRQRAEAQAQRKVAERESAAATSASDFLVGTFALSNPATENPRTITALTILSRAAERARNELKAQPQLEARLIATVAAAYLSLGLFHEAEQAITRSMPAIRQAGATGATALIRLGDAELLKGNTTSALEIADSVDKILDRSRESHPRLRALAATLRGRAYAALLQAKPSIAAFDHALFDLRAARDRAAGDLPRVLLDQGQVLSDDGQFDAAETSLGAALSLAHDNLGSAHRLTGAIWNALAQNAFQSGKLTLAEQRADAALAIQRKVLDPDNPILADVVLMQGQIYLGQKRYPAAEKSLRQALGIYRAAFQKPHYLVGITDVYLALTLSGRGDLKGSLAAFDDAKRNYDASYGKLHANHGDLLVNRATVLAHFGRKREAVKDCTDGLAILAQTLGAQASYTKTMTATCAAL